ncbi:Myb-like DNA-binding domain containing protein [Tritrichomonas foetus]|uniref:Myb-like DNA-binding domain containing protein n=1 Tax=Tritrichomonas foetus TaxID=1144522 RepID=A0A1J4L523_9EUKA|nr:Myb-like DNA-binding domain containing protein [Tritrichomonas foetus]|eukprot:OHT17038.1 Myb-like DNA-binding domain containing protein [Tritrichomonas foetus]
MLTSSPIESRQKRMPFKPNEDARLRELVEKYGDMNWAFVASQMPNRSVRQCRERWQNNLAAGVSKKKWTKEEDELLNAKYSEFGPRWKFFESFFPGRTSYNIRNRWQCKVRLWNIYSSQNIKLDDGVQVFQNNYCTSEGSSMNSYNNSTVMSPTCTFNTVNSTVNETTVEKNANNGNRNGSNTSALPIPEINYVQPVTDFTDCMDDDFQIEIFDDLVDDNTYYNDIFFEQEIMHV